MNSFRVQFLVADHGSPPAAGDERGCAGCVIGSWCHGREIPRGWNRWTVVVAQAAIALSQRDRIPLGVPREPRVIHGRLGAAGGGRRRQV